MTGPSAGTNGFLFCDLRGYAAYADAHGDRAAAELLATYRGLVRAVIATHKGAEIRTEGDSVYVVFPTASAAVEAGLGIVGAAASAGSAGRPLRIGVGIHAGETVASDEGPVGGAVNIAARVCAKAQAGEVLVTDTVRALTRTLLPYRFVGLGAQRLKGIGGVPLYRVEATSAGRLAHLRRRLSARRRLVMGVALLAVVVLVAGSAAWAATRPVPCLALGPTTKDVVARIDPARGCVVATYPVGQRPGPIAISRSTVWVANTDSWTVSLLDAATGAQQVAGLPGTPTSLAITPTGDLVALVYDDRARNPTWTGKSLVFVTVADARDVTEFELPVLDPDRELVLTSDSRPSPSGFTAMAPWAREILVTNHVTGDVLRVAFDGMAFGQAHALAVKEPTTVSTYGGVTSWESGVAPIAASGATAWIGDTTAPSLYRYSGGASAERVPLNGAAGTTAIIATETTVWLLRTDGSLTAVDPVTGTGRDLAPGGKPSSLAVAGGAVWVGDAAASTIRRIDPNTGATFTTIATGGQPKGLAIDADGSVWVSISAP